MLNNPDREKLADEVKRAKDFNVIVQINFQTLIQTQLFVVSNYMILTNRKLLF
jgi:hypothetical protein